MKLTSIILALLIALLATGCTGFTSVAKQMSRSDATFILSASTPYGPQRIVRVGSDASKVSVTPDGSVVVTPLGPEGTPGRTLNMVP